MVFRFKFELKFLNHIKLAKSLPTCTINMKCYIFSFFIKINIQFNTLTKTRLHIIHVLSRTVQLPRARTVSCKKKCINKRA